MADTVDAQTRSRIMGKVPRFDTKPELSLRRALHAQGLRFRLHRRDLPGRPDITLPRFRATIFVHGCFWHRHQGCKRTTTPSARTDFWLEKFDSNQARDRKAVQALLDAGWKVATVWECAIRTDPAAAATAVVEWLDLGETVLEMPPRYQASPDRRI